MAISYDDKFVFSGLDDACIIKWQISDGLIKAKFEGHTNLVTSIALSLDNNILVSGSYDCNIIIWDVESAKIIRTLCGHS